MEAVPLDKRRVPRASASGSSRASASLSTDDCLPALHADWKKPIQFVVYLPPPELNVRLTDPGKWEAWQERVTFIEEDLHWLLRLPHHKFWSQIVFDETLQKCLDSYLRYAPRPFDKDLDLTGEFAERHKNIHKMVFLVCLRTSTHKESKDDFISSSAFGQIIYDNFLFDVPKLMDIAVLYGGDNKPIVAKMIANVFKQQPKFMDDVRSSVPTMINVLKSLEEKCGVSDTASSDPAPLPRSSSSRPRSPLQQLVNDMTEVEMKDVILYIADIAFSLHAFLDCFEDAVTPFFEADFHLELPSFYEAVIPTLKEAHLKRRWEDPELRDFLREKLTRAHLVLAAVFRQLCQGYCVKPILEMASMEKMDPSKITNLIEVYLQAYTTCLSYRKFVASYENQFPVRDDMDVIGQFAGSYCDETQINFILDGFHASLSSSSNNVKAPASLTQLFKSSSPSSDFDANSIDVVANANRTSSNNIPTHVAAMSTTTGSGVGNARPSTPSGVELDSLITNVRDILPDLGEGFIEAALAEYGFNSESVVNALLEDNLTPKLRSMDRKKADRKPKSKRMTPSPKLNAFEEEHKNIYDDVGFEGLKDLHVGKRETAKNAKVMLDDKSHVDKSRYQAYANADVGSGSAYDQEKSYMYDDEYDDTYDDNLVGAEDADDVGELGDETGRNFVLPRILRQQQHRDRREDGGNDDDEDDGEVDQGELPPWKRPGNSLGIEDPSVLRERAAQRRASRGGHRGGGGGMSRGGGAGGGGGTGGGGGGGSSNVVGNPRGQGQDKSTDIARKRKDANKAARANHNRKSQAGRKQARGMF